jgi:hypothetical protein
MEESDKTHTHEDDHWNQRKFFDEQGNPQKMSFIAFFAFWCRKENLNSGAKNQD